MLPGSQFFQSIGNFSTFLSFIIYYCPLLAPSISETQVLSATKHISDLNQYLPRNHQLCCELVVISVFALSIQLWHLTAHRNFLLISGRKHFKLMDAHEIQPCSLSLKFSTQYSKFLKGKQKFYKSACSIKATKKSPEKSRLKVLQKLPGY